MSKLYCRLLHPVNSMILLVPKSAKSVMKIHITVTKKEIQLVLIVHRDEKVIMDQRRVAVVLLQQLLI